MCAESAGAEGRRQRIRRFIAERFDSKANLGLDLTVALLIAAAGVWAFGALLDAVLDNATLVRWDIATDAWIHDRATPGGLAFFDAVTRIGSPVAMAVLAVVGGIVLLLQRRYTILVAWAASFIGAGILSYVLKLVVHRTRPPHAAEFFAGQSFSFPSGHAMGSLVGYGMLVYVLGFYWHPPKWARLTSRLIIASVVILVGLSRVYLGVHYPSDVLGGYAAGAAWMAVCVAAASVALHRRGDVSSS